MFSPNSSRHTPAARFRAVRGPAPGLATFTLGAGALVGIAAALLYAVANLSH